MRHPVQVHLSDRKKCRQKVDAYTKFMPYHREWLRNHVQHTDTLMHKRHMIIPDIPYIHLIPGPRCEEAIPIIFLICIREGSALS